MSKPKLALIPSGYKSGKVYSILPNDASGDFDFTRQSIGTRVRKDGLIEEAKTIGSITNDFLHSEDYSQSEWNKSNLTVTTNQELAPDGTNTADEIFETSATSFKNINQQTSVTANKRYTTSFFVKYNNIQYLQITGSSGFPSSIVNFDIQNKTIVHNPSNELARIDELANGWARISLTLLCSTTTNGRMLIVAINSATASRLPSYTGNTSNSFYLWGGMMSEGALSDYIKTEGSSETKTVETFTDVPRLDWLNSNCPSLLLEPQRTNSILQSNDPSGANWTDPLSRWNLLTDTTTAPDGRNVRIIELTESGGSLIRLSGLSISAGTYTVSFYIKDIDGNLSGGSVDIGDEGSGAPTPAFSDVGSDWVRLTRTITTTGTKTFVDLQPSFTGSTNKVAIWGAQVEAGSYATSLIKTEASTVTRLKDECLNGGDSDLFNIIEGTFFVDATPFTYEATERITLSNNNYNNRILISKANASQLQFIVVSNNITVATKTQNINYNQRNKIAFTFKENEFKFYLNGSLVHTDTSGSVPTGLNDLSFKGIGSALYWNGKIHDTRVYDRVLTEAEAIELTL